MPFSRIVQDKLSATLNRARKRLMRDLKEIKENPLSGVAALPVEDDLFHWHANLKGPAGTPWENGIFHFEMRFPNTYPDSPPSLKVCTRISHPNVFGDQVCLDMLQVFHNTDSVGWTPAYSVQAILVQLQAFLFESDATTVLKDLEDPTQYEIEKKKWLASVKFAVERSRSYQDPSVNHHAPRRPWPAFPETDEDKATTGSAKEFIRNELLCFYTKQMFTEDCLGMGLSFRKNLRTGEIKEITAYPDFVSLRAFMNHSVRTSAMNERFTHWLPVYINKEHGEKAHYLAKRALSMICTGSTRSFSPDHVFHVLPKLMSSMVVQIMSGRKASSVRALRGYCAFHRLFLLFVEEYPELKEKAQKKVEAFIASREARHKDHTPNLGEMLTLLSICDFTWEQIREAYLDESQTRNVFWILAKYPELERLEHKHITDEDRLKYSFQVSKVGQRLLLFHIFFLRHLACPAGKTKQQIAADYDNNYGYPAPAVEDMFSKTCQEIEEIEDYEAFFKAVGSPKSRAEIAALLKESILRSCEAKYHGSGPKVQTVSEFEAENQIDLDKLAKGGELITDEEMWKSMCAKEWGIETLPKYLESSTEPWKRFFLQNHLQDTVEKLNEAPDFKRFYNILHHSSEWIQQLEIQAFNPDNIKSRFYFLTAILTQLSKLNTLVITKSESGLGVRGFKALVKGLGKNPGCLETLNLEYCDINDDAIKQLTKGDLISRNLRRLHLSGNPLGSGKGIIELSKFLRQHNRLPELEELDVSSTSMNSRSGQALAEALLVKKNLKKLNIGRNPLTNGLSFIIKNLAYSPSIEEVVATKTTGKAETALDTLLELSITLKTLDLSMSPALGLCESNFRALGVNKSLRVLDISKTNLQNSLGKALGTALSQNNTLEELNLSRNGLKGKVLTDILEVLKQAKKAEEQVINLKVLRLSSTLISLVVDDKQTNVLGKLLLRCPDLEELYLDNCGLNKDWAEGMAPVFDPVNNLKIRKLDLRQNAFGKHGLKPLVSNMANNTVLEELDVSGNDLGVLGAKYLGLILKENQSLKHVSAYGNLMEIEGAIELAQALKHNTTLETLDLGLNRFRMRGANAIAEFIASGKCSLKTLLLKSNRINDKMGMKIAKAVVGTSCHLSKIALAGNYLTDSIRAEIALLLSQSSRQIQFDLAQLAEVKDPERQERTIYITPLPDNVTEQMIKKLFYTNNCGVCLSVDIKPHKTRREFSKAKYAFVTFANPDSVQLATSLAAKGEAKIANATIKISRAGLGK